MAIQRLLEHDSSLILAYWVCLDIFTICISTRPFVKNKSKQNWGGSERFHHWFFVFISSYFLSNLYILLFVIEIFYSNNVKKFGKFFNRRINWKGVFVQCFYLYRTAPLKENRKSKKIFFRKKGSSVFAFSVCPSVCVSVCLCVCVFAACRPQFLA